MSLTVSGARRSSHRGSRRLLAFLVAAATGIAVLVGFAPPQRAHAATPATTGSLALAVIASRTNGGVAKGTPVVAYHWSMSPEDTGNPSDTEAHCMTVQHSGGAGSGNPAQTCGWPSVRLTPGAVGVWSAGDQTDFLGGKVVTGVPAGRYLISVSAPGFRLDGAHVTVTGGATSAATVRMDPLPLALGTIRLHVFADIAPVDATYEAGVEPAPADATGFTAHLNDVLGEVTNDWFGNPLCTVYENRAQTGPADQVTANDALFLGADGKPVVSSSPGCHPLANGDVVIPNVGPNRYTATVVPPTGSGWIQTTTLEGNHDHDVWPQQADTGYDNEITVGAEKVPSVDFGYVQPAALPAGPTGHVTGRLVGLDSYVPGKGGVPVPGANVAGAKPTGPIADGVVALSDLNNADRAVAVQRTAADGTFDVSNVPNGDYQLTYWDENQDHIINSDNVSVKDGQVTDVGTKGLVGWYTTIKGSVFVDANGNGKRDPGEQGVPNFVVTIKGRDNTLLIEGGINNARTDDNGNYSLTEVYPLGKWLIEEFFNTRFQTTGVTVQGDNEPQEHTYLGSAVDLSLLPVISESGRVDIGVKPYAGRTNGGIVGTVTYDTTRNELDPRYAVTEAYQPGIPNVPVHMYAPVGCAPATYTSTDGSTCTVNAQSPQGGDVAEANGALRRGPELTSPYTSETYQAPKGCVPRDVNGTPLDVTQQQAVPAGTDPSATCVEAPMTGWQVAPGDATTGAFGQTVNGNYGFSTSSRNLVAPGVAGNPAPGGDLPQYAPLDCSSPSTECSAAIAATPSLAGMTSYSYAPQPLTAGQYLLAVDIPKDGLGRPLYKATDEASVNVFDGDTYTAQGNFPLTAQLPSGGGNHTPLATGPGISLQANPFNYPACAGGLQTVTVPDTSPGFTSVGGSPFEGQQRPTCDAKLVTVRTGQAIAPNFNLYTEVPLPTHFWGLVINDLGLSNDTHSASFGEAEPLPNVPVGLYDWAGRLDDTVKADPNGFYEALEPSTGTYNCPLPAGPCPGIYRLVGNDPGQPGALNANYNPRYRTIATNFQAWPGNFIATDLAPTAVGPQIVTPGSKTAQPVSCTTPATSPQLLSVDRPALRSNDPRRSVVVSGYGFGTTGTVTLTASRSTAVLQPPTSTWSDGSVTVTIPPATPADTYTLSLATATGGRTVNGIRLHVLPAANAAISPVNPPVITVNAPAGAAPANVLRAFVSNPATQATGTDYVLQNALSFAASRDSREDTGITPLVLVWPNPADTVNPASLNPRGEYLETVVVSGRIDVQGVGPGGFRPVDNSWVPGTIIDGRGFSGDNAQGTHWLSTVAAAGPVAGPAQVPDAATVTVLTRTGAGRAWSAQRHASLDGLQITGGTQNDVNGNQNVINGNVTTGTNPTGALVTQGGGVYVHGAATSLRISDDVVVGNSGSYGGGIRIGTPYTDAGSRNVRIVNDRITDNGGTNLAGGIGIFRGSNGYVVAGSDLCGNMSAEYGGAVTQYGLSPNGSIDHDRIWFNQSYDEGGGVMLAGELAPMGQLSPGTGEETVSHDVIAENLANDDGGGLRTLQAGTKPVHVTDDAIVENVSAHEGGGVALDDSTDVRLVNDTVSGNLTTATAVTSTGTPAPAGLSTAGNSVQLQAVLPTSAPRFSKPLLVNDVFWDNRAGSYDSGTATLSGLDTAAANHWDVGNVDLDPANPGPGQLTASSSFFQSAVQGSQTYLAASSGTTANHLGVDPAFAAPYTIGVQVQPWRNFPAFRQATIIAANVPPSASGDYHPKATSPVIGAGRASTTTLVPAVTPNEVPGSDLLDVLWGPAGTLPDAGAYRHLAN